MSAFADYRVEISWGGETENPFTFGTSLLGGGDELVDALSPDFTGPFDDVSGEVGSIAIRRGRSDPMSFVAVGTCDIVLRGDRYNPLDPDGDLFGLLVPMRHVLVTSIYDGVDYPRFRGFVRSLSYDPRRREATLHCEDPFLWISRIKPVVSEQSGTTGELILAILEAAGWNLPPFLDVATEDGDEVEAFSMEGTVDSRSALDGIADLIEAEQGLFYFAKDGAATYRDRHHQVGQESSLALVDKFLSTRPGTSMDGIRNIARVAKGDAGNVQEARDEQSIALYGPASTEIVSDYFVDDAHALALAEYLVFRFGSPGNLVWSIPMLANVDDGLLAGVLAAELFERISVSDNRANLDGDFYLEGVEESIRPPAFHEVNWTVSARPEGSQSVFTFGESTLGGGNILAYY